MPAIKKFFKFPDHCRVNKFSIEFCLWDDKMWERLARIFELQMFLLVIRQISILDACQQILEIPCLLQNKQGFDWVLPLWDDRMWELSAGWLGCVNSKCLCWYIQYCKELLRFKDIPIPNPSDPTHFLLPSGTKKYIDEKKHPLKCYQATSHIKTMTPKKWTLKKNITTLQQESVEMLIVIAVLLQDDSI